MFHPYKGGEVFLTALANLLFTKIQWNCVLIVPRCYLWLNWAIIKRHIRRAFKTKNPDIRKWLLEPSKCELPKWLKLFSFWLNLNCCQRWSWMMLQWCCFSTEPNLSLLFLIHKINLLYIIICIIYLLELIMRRKFKDYISCRQVVIQIFKNYRNTALS